MKQSMIELKGQVYDLNVIRSSALCLRTNHILHTSCATHEASYVIKCSSGYTVKISFDGKLLLLKDGLPVEPLPEDHDNSTKPASLVECLRKMSVNPLLTNPHSDTAYKANPEKWIKTTVLSKAIVDMAIGRTSMIAVQLTELSVMEELLIEALQNTHVVTFTDGAHNAIIISKSGSRGRVNKNADAQCQIAQMHN